jgi:predicted AlkP superfamily pyrophosphatase or phosphodiesterase
MRFAFPFFLFFISLWLSLACTGQTPIRFEQAENKRADPPKSDYLVLISLDGFRWDYIHRFQPPNLLKFIEYGVQSKAMVPSYPSKTFPNHYTIATGMYPNNHGLVDNSFFDAEKGAVYRMNKREIVEDGSWYAGTPIWVLAGKAGMRTASYFFVGSEADIQGIRPDEYYRYDGTVSHSQRVRQVLEWLGRPEAERPRLITLYFSDMDDVGHRYGPNADAQLQEKLSTLDQTLGTLFEGIRNTGLPVNIIIVSDHGMSEVSPDNLLPIESIEEDGLYQTINNGALAHLHLREGVSGEHVFQKLRASEKHFRIYHTTETPGFETPPNNPRWGDFLVVPDSGYYFANARMIGLRKMSSSPSFGEHGFHPDNPDMHGVFFANGPAFPMGKTIPSFKNIHVYPLMCRLLKLDIPHNIDGKAELWEKWQIPKNE